MEIPKFYDEFIQSAKPAIDQICKPLFENTKINYFDYEYYSDEGGYFTVTTDPVTSYYYLSKKLYPTRDEFDRQMNLNGVQHESYVFLSEVAAPPSGAVNRQKFIDNVLEAKFVQIHHRIYFLKREPDAYKVYGFGVRKDDRSIFEFYLNNIDFLERFICYFEFQLAGLLKKGKNTLILLPGFAASESLVEEKSTLSDPLPILLPNSFEISVKNFDSVKFTKREMECLVLKIQGNTAKEIGRFLGISYRTVEKTLLNARDKIPGVSRSDLKMELENLGVISLFRRNGSKKR